MAGGVGAIHDEITCNGILRFTGFGRFYRDEEVDGGFAPLQQPDDGKKELPVTKLLPQVARALGIREILAPKPVFGRGVVNRNMLTARIVVGDEASNVTLLRGHEGDICVLEPSETYGISAAGCIIAAICYLGNEEKVLKPKMLAAHLGLKCLIDYKKMLGKTPSWFSESVVGKISEELALPPKEMARVKVILGFPIAPEQYEHRWDYPESGADNEKLCHYLVERWGEECIMGWSDPKLRQLGRINLERIARAQLLELGISDIHSTPCYERMLHSDGKPLWYTTRGPFREEKRRNLVLVTHLA